MVKYSWMKAVLAVAIVVLPPASVGVAPKLAADADVAVGLYFAQALSILHLGSVHCSRALGNIAARFLLALGKHLRCLLASNRILRKHAIGDVIYTYLIVGSWGRSQNRHCGFSF